MTTTQMQAIGWLVGRLEWEDTLEVLRARATLDAAEVETADVPVPAPSPDRGMSRGAMDLTIRA